MTKVTIDRELLERLAEWDQFPHKMKDALTELRAILAAPRQPEGEGLTRYNLFCSYDGGGPAEAEESPDGDYVLHADAQSVIAELREECEHLKECQENAMLHMTGLVAERDTLRQQLAEARDEITQHSNDLTLAYMKGGADMRHQRDKLAGLLSMVRQDGWYHPLEEHEIAQIEAALDEVTSKNKV